MGYAATELGDAMLGALRSLFGERQTPLQGYQASVQERVRQHKNLTDAVWALFDLRERVAEERDRHLAELERHNARVSTQQNAAYLVQRRTELVRKIEMLSAELFSVSAKAEQARCGLTEFEAQVAQLEHDKAQMLAARA